MELLPFPKHLKYSLLVVLAGCESLKIIGVLQTVRTLTTFNERIAMQPVPDAFYAAFVVYAFMGYFTERVLHLFLMLRIDKNAADALKPGDHYVIALIGLVTSSAVVGYLLLEYGAHTTLEGMKYMYDMVTPAGILLYAIVIIHVMTIPLSLYMLVWFYRRPSSELEKRLARRHR